MKLKNVTCDICGAKIKEQTDCIGSQFFPQVITTTLNKDGRTIAHQQDVCLLCVDEIQNMGAKHGKRKD